MIEVEEDLAVLASEAVWACLGTSVVWLQDARCLFSCARFGADELEDEVVYLGAKLVKLVLTKEHFTRLGVATVVLETQWRNGPKRVDHQLRVLVVTRKPKLNAQILVAMTVDQSLQSFDPLLFSEWSVVKVLNEVAEGLDARGMLGLLYAAVVGLAAGAV